MEFGHHCTADVLAPNGARPSADTRLTWKATTVFYQDSMTLSSNLLCGQNYIMQNGHLLWPFWMTWFCPYNRADSRFAPSQWETSLQSNADRGTSSVTRSDLFLSITVPINISMNNMDVYVDHPHPSKIRGKIWVKFTACGEHCFGIIKKECHIEKPHT